jgi:hypothetical protein
MATTSFQQSTMTNSTMGSLSSIPQQAASCYSAAPITVMSSLSTQHTNQILNHLTPVTYQLVQDQAHSEQIMPSGAVISSNGATSTVHQLNHPTNMYNQSSSTTGTVHNTLPLMSSKPVGSAAHEQKSNEVCIVNINQVILFTTDVVQVQMVQCAYLYSKEDTRTSTAADEADQHPS